MIELFCTVKAVNNTAVICFAFPVAFKQIKFFGASRVTLYDSAVMAGATSQRVIAEFSGTVNSPHEGLSCQTNEIIQCDNGVVAVGVGADATTSIRFYSMNNPVGSQGS